MAQLFSRLEYQVITLAANAQASTFISRLANGLTPESSGKAALVRGISIKNTPSMDDIFEDITCYKQGLNSLDILLNRNRGREEENNIRRYSNHSLQIAKELRKNENALAQLGRQLSSLDEEADAFELEKIYIENLSVLAPPLRIYGIEDALENKMVAAEIRVMLLAGVRFSWLWYQLGGRRLHLTLKKQSIKNTGKDIIKYFTSTARGHR